MVWTTNLDRARKCLLVGCFHWIVWDFCSMVGGYIECVGFW